jgi:hypothetical protein
MMQSAPSPHRASRITHEIIHSILPERMPRQDIELLPRRALGEDRRVDRNVSFENSSEGFALFVRGMTKVNCIMNLVLREEKVDEGGLTCSSGITRPVLVLPSRIVEVRRMYVNRTRQTLGRRIMR